GFGGGGRGGAGFGGAGVGAGAGGGGGGGGGPGEHGVQGGRAAVSGQGGLNPEQIRRVVMAHRAALQACYEIEAQKDPTLKGGMTVSWTIDPAGAVTSATVAGSTIRNARVEGCVLRQVRAWHFPSSDGPSQATFPFSFGIGR
ncbi:MAG: AgmX/PglI C-terminal domain-containing protein, partial [Myxococcota bacterium]|nr:AgmX/PglI C-terminal domain-containing protein [Myxococcota bacterium]